MINNPIPKFISRQKAIQQFKLVEFPPLNRVDVSAIVVMEGDTHIKGDFDNWYESLEKDNPEYDESLMVIINGDLKVDGTVTGKKDFNAHLLVLGDLYCDFLISCDEVTHVTGNAFVKYVFDGNYNDGYITIKGMLDVPYLLNSDHYSDVNPSENTILISYFSSADHYFDYDIVKDDFGRALITEIYPVEKFGSGFDRTAFYNVVKSGRSPFVEDFKVKKLQK